MPTIDGLVRVFMRLYPEWTKDEAVGLLQQLANQVEAYDAAHNQQRRKANNKRPTG